MSPMFWQRDGSERSGREHRYPEVEEGYFETLYDFEGEDCIGKGSFGEIWKVTKKGSEDVKAVKAMNKSECIRTSENISLQTLYTEVDALKALRHPHVIQFFECINEPEILYIVMEYVPGESLREKLLDTTPIDEQLVQIIGYQVLLALQYCKDKAVVHRDIKPENILITRKPSVKLIDFGLSHIVNLKSHKPEDKFLTKWCGTLFYASPQIFRQEPYSYKTDYWSLGVVLFELLGNGVRPFDTETNRAGRYNDYSVGTSKRTILKKRICKGDFKFENSRWKEISSAAKNLVSKLIVVSEDERYGAEEALKHEWFKSLQKKLLERSVKNVKPRDNGSGRSAVDKWVGTVAAFEAACVFGSLMKSDKKKEGNKSDSVLYASDKTRGTLSSSQYPGSDFL